MCVHKLKEKTTYFEKSIFMLIKAIY